MDEARHIRTTDANVTDHRFRSVSRLPNKLRTTMCGAAPTTRDVSRKDARHVVTTLAPLRPDWTADYCPRCLEALKSI